MQSATDLLVVAEDDYATGPIFRSGADKQNPLTVRRTRFTTANPDVSLSWGNKPGYVARLFLAAANGSTIWQAGNRVMVPPRRVWETSFREVSEPCFSRGVHPMDQIRFELPEAALARWMEDHRQTKIGQLELESGSSVMDPTLIAFGRAALSSLEQPDHASQFFIDHILSGMCTYLFEAFGGEPKKVLAGGLVPWQERRAKALIDSRLGSDLTLEELARECGLSVAHFTRAFRQSVGESPHRWLMRRRVEKARQLLVDTDKRLAEIAADCGFADQSHFTNVFSEMIGAPPGAFRREKNALKGWDESARSSRRSTD